MIFAVDFDGTVVVEGDRRYDDVWSPLRLQPGVKAGLLSLKRAGHHLLLYSGRSNRARQYMPDFDPLVRAGVVVEHRSPDLHAARYRQMLDFVATHLPGIFDAIDDGRQGKPHADRYIDDRGITFGGPHGFTWNQLAALYGE